MVDVRSYGDEYDFGNTQFLIKRLIAVEGDTVYCEDRRVYIRYAERKNLSRSTNRIFPMEKYILSARTKWVRTRSSFSGTTA